MSVKVSEWYSRRADSILPREILDLLDDLAVLDTNLESVEETFNAHYAQFGGLNPEIHKQSEIQKKALEGFKQAKIAQDALQEVVKAHPEHKPAVRAYAEAVKMVSHFREHANKARAIIMKIAGKELPAQLKKLAAEVEKAIKARLKDPSLVSVIPWQQISPRFLKSEVDGVRYSVTFLPSWDDPNHLHGREEEHIELYEDTNSNPAGVWMRSPGSRTPEVATKEAALALFLRRVQGWDNIRGEVEGRIFRRPKAEAIRQILIDQLKRKPDSEDPHIFPDYRRVEVAYRSNLPKEGEAAVGERVYRQMSEREMSDIEKSLQRALAPYKDVIEKIEVNDDGKAWIRVTVWLV